MRLSNIRDGFTLAEVLITLGIIGVVAAMTMPTLMNQTNGAQYKAAYKKALSAISQAVTLNVALDEWNFADLEAETGGTNTLKSLFEKRMNVVRTETAAPKLADGTTAYSPKKTADASAGAEEKIITDADRFIFFNDGIMFAYKAASAVNCTIDETLADTPTKCEGYIDVNGIKAPNKVVKCDKGQAGGTGADSCQVTNPTDIYPVYFYDQTIVPKTSAAKAVLYSK